MGVGERLFRDITAGLVKKTRLSVALQRLDSTHIISNIAVLTRLGLLVETVLVFLRALRREHPTHLAGLPATYQKRYLDREGYFADAKKAEVPRRLKQTAADMHRLIERFTQVPEVAALESYAIMLRVFSEQCAVQEVAPESADDEAVEPTVVVKEPAEISADSVQSPHDPDARYGHKGKGYEVQIAETCGDAEAPIRLITHVSLNGANESDTRATIPVIDALDEAGLKPMELLADTAYSGGANLIEAAAREVELIAPVLDPNKDKRDADPATHPPGLAGFTFNTTCDEVFACTAAHEPRASAMRDGLLVAVFAAAQCADCPFAHDCPTRRAKNGDRQLRRRPSAIATALRQYEQRQAYFKERYKLRSGIESLNRELKQRHGFSKPRVRGRPRLELAVQFKAMALNTKRAVEYYASLVAPPAELLPSAIG